MSNANRLSFISKILIITLVISMIPTLHQIENIYADELTPVNLSVNKGAIVITALDTETMRISGTTPENTTININKDIKTPIKIVGEYTSGGHGSVGVTDNNIKIDGGKLDGNKPINISIDSVGISLSDKPPLGLENKANVKLTIINNNYLNSITYESAAVDVMSGNTIDICGSGTLFASGGNNSSSIGGAVNKTSGNINISSGNINISTKGGGAGIGGGYRASGGNTNISGGTIVINDRSLKPTGQYGAAIGGGGQGGSGGTITITGGDIYAKAMLGGAAIGSGGTNIITEGGGSGGTIKILGGTVRATGGSFAASIGGGWTGSGANLTISGKNTYVWTKGDGMGEIGAGDAKVDMVGKPGSIDIDNGAILELGERGIEESIHAPLLKVGECEITGAGVKSNSFNSTKINDLGGKYVNVTLGGTPVFEPTRASYLKTNGNVYTVKLNTKININPTLPDAEYDFVGWYDKNTGELYSTDPAIIDAYIAKESSIDADYVSLSRKEVNGNIYLYLEHTYDENIEITVDGEVVDSSKVKVEKDNGIKITILDSYRKTLDPKAHTLNVSSSSININDIIFSGSYGKSDPVITTYNITLDVNGGNSISNKVLTINKDGKYGNLPSPTRKGYKFDGWHTAKSGGIKVDGSTTIINANHTLYARWSKIYKGNIKDAKVTLANTTYAYTGGKITPGVTVTIGDVKLGSSDYKLSYNNNVYPGKGIITVTGQGDYDGTATAYFAINKPVVKTTSISKVTSKKKSLTVKWKKVSGVTKYQVRYRLKGKKKWVTKTISPAKTSYTIKKLKKKKTYQVQVRSYRTVNKIKYESKWSGVKTKKTK